MIEHYSITVSGKVQGVFYRQHTLEAAVRLGLKGWVMNRPDGTVLIEAEGTAEQLNRLIEWCRSGPPRAIVNDVKCIKGELKNFSSFEIRR